MMEMITLNGKISVVICVLSKVINISPFLNCFLTNTNLRFHQTCVGKSKRASPNLYPLMLNFMCI